MKKVISYILSLTLFISTMPRLVLAQTGVLSLSYTFAEDTVGELPEGLETAIATGSNQKATQNSIKQLETSGFAKALESIGIKRGADGNYTGSGSGGAITDSDRKTISALEQYQARDQKENQK